ncbi:MAG: 50S ribosomal protein L21 [Patescibacteria group bacterium]
MSNFSIIETGGKQYKVAAGSKIKVEKLKTVEGDNFVFNKVLLRADGENITVGTPYISGAAVEGKVLAQARSKKVIIFKYHSKTRQRKKRGHRQHFTEVEVTKV